ncbi:MAG: hypothetical protein DRJ03_12010 [Chloroflexi bacterium]|nr:MAG: hypothetical protein DRJ03_12010 [Chloroflexota bacterium]
MIIHAAGESAQGVVPGTFAVALAAKNERALLKLEQKLRYAQIHHIAFREPDAPWCDALMSIGIKPVEDRRVVRRFLRGFPLLGADHAKK